MSTQIDSELRTFKHYHETELLDRLADEDLRPAGYAATLRPLGIRIRETHLQRLEPSLHMDDGS